jgi:hypothetical protein
MLAISPRASNAISRALAGASVPDGAGLRRLDDQVLDADVGPDGAITFALYTQGLVNGRSSQPGESAD